MNPAEARLSFFLRSTNLKAMFKSRNKREWFKSLIEEERKNVKAQLRVKENERQVVEENQKKSEDK